MPIECNGIMFSDVEPTDLVLEAARQALSVFLFQKYREMRPGPKRTWEMRAAARQWFLPVVRWERCLAYLTAKAAHEGRSVDEVTLARETDAWVREREPAHYPPIYLVQGLRRPGIFSLIWQHEVLMLPPEIFDDVVGRLDQEDADALRSIYRDRLAQSLGRKE